MTAPLFLVRRAVPTHFSWSRPPVDFALAGMNSDGITRRTLKELTKARALEVRRRGAVSYMPQHVAQHAQIHDLSLQFVCLGM